FERRRISSIDRDRFLERAALTLLISLARGQPRAKRGNALRRLKGGRQVRKSFPNLIDSVRRKGAVQLHPPHNEVTRSAHQAAFKPSLSVREIAPTDGQMAARQPHPVVFRRLLVRAIEGDTHPVDREGIDVEFVQAPQGFYR